MTESWEDVMSLSQENRPATDNAIDTTLTSPQDLPTYEETRIASMLDLYGGAIIIVIGTLGNIMAMIVLSRKKMRAHGTNLYFLTMAASDLTFVVVGQCGRHFIRAVGGTDLPSRSSIYCKTWYTIINYASGYSNWLLAGASLERSFAIVVPMKAKSLLTRKITVAYLLAALILTLVYYSHSAISYLSVQTVVNGVILSSCTVDATNYFAVEIRPWSDLVFKGLVPGLTIIISNIIIIWKVVAAKIRRRHLGSADADKTPSIVSMLIAISITYVVCTLPYHVSYIMTSAYPAGYKVAGKDAAINRLVWAVNIFLLYVNHSVNFLLYLVSGREFRRELKTAIGEMCGCRNWAALSRSNSGRINSGSITPGKVTSRETLNSFI